MKDSVNKNCQPLYIQSLSYWQLCYEFRFKKHPAGSQYLASTPVAILQKVDNMLNNSVLHPTVLKKLQSLKKEIEDSLNVNKAKTAC